MQSDTDSTLKRLEPRTAQEQTRLTGLASLFRKLAEQARTLHKAEIASTPAFAMRALGWWDAFSLVSYILQEESTPSLDISVTEYSPAFEQMMLGAMKMVQDAIKAGRASRNGGHNGEAGDIRRVSVEAQEHID